MLGALRDLGPYFRAYRAQLLLILLTILVGLSFDLFTPLALRFLIDNILGRQPLGFTVPGLAAVGEQIAVDQQIPALLMLLAVMVFMFLLNAYDRLRQSYLLATISEGVNLDLRRRFFQHLQRASPPQSSGRGCPFAGSVDCQNGCFIEGGRKESAGGMALVVLTEKQPLLDV